MLRDVLGDEIDDRGRDLQLEGGGLGAQDGDAGLEVGRLDVGGQAPLEAGD